MVLVLHRVRQFATADRKPTASDFAIADTWLPPALASLFRAQHPRDIVHTAATARWLLTRRHTDRDLIAAALLHDIGKGEQRRLDRAAFVTACYVGLATRLAASDSRLAIRRALDRTLAHSETAAGMLANAGASERVIALTRLHHAPPRGDRVLALLQQADAAS